MFLFKQIAAFLTSRNFKMRVGSFFSKPFNVFNGFLQDSVLGSKLFLLYTADISALVSSASALYADNIKLYVDLSKNGFQKNLDKM